MRAARSTWVVSGHVTWSRRDVAVRRLRAVGNSSETEPTSNHKTCNHPTLVQEAGRATL